MLQRIAVFLLFVWVFLSMANVTQANYTANEKAGSDWVYLTFSDNKTNDTVGSASTNDTSKTFVNGIEGMLVVEYIQNSISYSFTIPDAPVGTYRGRYLASDSTFVIERSSGIGWLKQYQLPGSGSQTSLVASSTMALRTGSLIFQVRRQAK